jgi:8-oxo-dGTP pyrophosphatase MutT (NUDIX family)
MTQAVGIFFYSKDTDRFLYLLRTDTKNPSWSIPGGKVKKQETLFDTIKRECTEEIGFFDPKYKVIPIQKFVNNNFIYHTFFCGVDREFIPRLNHEHTGYAWVGSGLYPKPLHFGLFSTINIDIVKEKILLLKEFRNNFDS